MTSEHQPDYRALKLTTVAHEMGITPAEVLEIDESIEQVVKQLIIDEGLVTNEEEADKAIEGLFLLQPDGTSYFDKAFFDQFYPKEEFHYIKVQAIPLTIF